MITERRQLKIMYIENREGGRGVEAIEVSLALILLNSLQ